MIANLGSIEDMSDDALAELLGPLRERNRGKLRQRLVRVRAAITDDHDRAPTQELRADLHALIGALGTYGWPHGSELLAQIQTEVAAGRSATAFVPEIDRLIAEVDGPSA
jgi:HPt (histidine-containing phosphotransfer) domain-containing protein